MNKNNKRYCCYRHFLEGKSAKDATYCYNHVSLGVINPVHSHPDPLSKLSIEGLSIQSKPFRIQNRTHDYNEIQHRQTLPQRLIKPRVYIEKIIGKRIPYKPFLGLKSTGAQQFDHLVYFYSQIGKLVKDRKQLEDIVKEFMIQKSLSIKGKDLLLSRELFECFMIGKFSFSEEDAALFWEIAYNDRRFKKKQSVSMQAFTYNFQKCYLQTLHKFKNMFSQSALRQRLIDIRVILRNWKKNNIFLKENLREQTGIELDICLFFKKNVSEQLFTKFTSQLEKRNKIHFTLRSIAKCLYHLTDDKYLSYERVKSAVVESIQEKSNILRLSQKIVDKFIQTKQIGQQEEFPITQILQFMHLEGVKQYNMELMMKWLRGIFKYLYFHKGIHQLVLDKSTLKLQCSELIKINLPLVRQYQGYMKNQCDDFVNVLGELMEQTDDILSLIPELSGPKRTIVECNYIAQSLLRYINKISLLPFYKISKIIQIYQSDQNNVSGYENIFSQERIKKEAVQRDMKSFWMFYEQSQIQQNHIPTKDKSDYQHVMKQYLNISKGIKSYKKTQGSKSNRQKSQRSNVQNEKGDKISSNNNDEILEIEIEKGNADLKEMLKIPEECKERKVKHSPTCMRECCRNVPLQMSQSISTVEGLESHLMDLLNI